MLVTSLTDKYLKNGVAIWSLSSYSNVPAAMASFSFSATLVGNATLPLSFFTKRSMDIEYTKRQPVVHVLFT